MFKFILTLTLILGVPAFAQVTPCEDFACDSTVIRTIMQENEMEHIFGLFYV